MKSEDIAKIAGVSRSTVSRVINNYSNVPEKTREKVMRVIKEYNYMPNSYARTLAGKKNNTIGLFFIISGDTNTDCKIFQNDYYTNYLDAIVDQANGMGYYVLVHTVTKNDDYDKVNQAFIEKRIDGGIIIGTQDEAVETIDLSRINSSLVIFDLDAEKRKYLQEHSKSRLCVINTLDEKAIKTTMQNLYDQGHRQIGMIKGTDYTYSGRMRYQAYLEMIQLLGLEYEEKYVIEGMFSPKIAYQKVNQLALGRTLPSAFLAGNDYMAIAAINALVDNGVRVPDDVSIIGFDNVGLGRQITPSLTTFNQPYYEIGSKAVEILDLYIREGEAKQSLFEYDVQLIKRQSTQ